MMKTKRMAIGIAAAVAATGTVLTPAPTQADPPSYFLECVAGSYVSAKQAVTRGNVMGCAGGVLFLTNRGSGAMKAYGGNWCVYTGQKHKSWTGWQILGSDCKAWLK